MVSENLVSRGVDSPSECVVSRGVDSPVDDRVNSHEILKPGCFTKSGHRFLEYKLLKII